MLHVLPQEADKVVADAVVGLERLRLVLVEKVAHDELASDQYHALLALLVQPAGEGVQPLLVVGDRVVG